MTGDVKAETKGEGAGRLRVSTSGSDREVCISAREQKAHLVRKHVG